MQDKQEYIDSYSKLVIKEGFDHTLNHIVVNAKMTKMKNLLHEEFAKSCVISGVGSGGVSGVVSDKKNDAKKKNHSTTCLIADQEKGNVIKETNNNISIHKVFTIDDGKESLRINKSPAKK